MRIGLLGGTFDPIHVGHLDVADAARSALRLDRVMLIPANIPPHRPAPHASSAHRFAMTALAIQDRDALMVSDLEMSSNEPSYTSATLDRLSRLGLETRALFLITGADAFREIASWKDYPQLLDRCHFAVVSRPGTSALTMPSVLPELAGRMVTEAADPSRPVVVLIDAATAPVSSTEVRRRAAAGQSIHGLVPAAVAAHIGRHELYAATPR